MSDHVEAVVVGDSDRARSPRLRRGFVGSLPGFTYILILYVIGKYAFHNPRAPIFDFLGYQLSWVEVLYFIAAIVAMSEQIKVAKPGIDKSGTVLAMGALAIGQIILFTLAAANTYPLNTLFNNTEFLLLTLINVVQTAVAYIINSATLQRTISS